MLQKEQERPRHLPMLHAAAASKHLLFLLNSYGNKIQKIIYLMNNNNKKKNPANKLLRNAYFLCALQLKIMQKKVRRLVQQELNNKM